MALSVKKKIWLGTLFLFFLLLLTGGAGIYYMARLKTEGKNILQDNYIPRSDPERPRLFGPLKKPSPLPHYFPTPSSAHASF